MRSLGIDIGGSSIKVALHDERGVQTAQSVGYANPSREVLCDAFADSIGTLGSGIGPNMPIGLCVPGKQNARGDRVKHSFNLPCLNDWFFEELLHAVLGFVPSQHRVVSDIHATAFDLAMRSGAQGRIAVVAIGTGVGFAMIEDGHILSVGLRGVGNLGQLDVGRCDTHDRVGASGTLNPLESYVGVRALREREGCEDEDAVISHIRQMTVSDPFLRALTRALQTVHAIHTPDTMILAGGIGIALRAQHELLVRCVNEGLTKLAARDWELRFGESLFHAASGAARLASE